MRSFDVIVVGAGPAGCAAAYDLAAAGIGVLLLDRKAFPRVKPCAGALTIKAVNRLRYSIAPVIRFVVRELEIALGPLYRRRLQSEHPVAVMTVREEFDSYCLAQTMAKGAEFAHVVRVQSVSEDAQGVTLFTEAGSFRCRYLIGADGANSQVRKLMARAQLPQALALEGTVKANRPFLSMRFDFTQVEGGYGWIFPKGDHLNIGLYTHRPGVTFSKADLLAYAKAETGADAVDDMIGYPIGIGGDNEAAGEGRVLFVGDAAGMTERLMGEGIHNAIVSGQAAAASVISVLRRHDRIEVAFAERLRDVQQDLKACSTASDWFYGLPPFCYGALISHRRWTPLMRGFAAGMTFREIMRSYPLSRFYRVPRVPSVVEYEECRARQPRSALAQ